MKKKFLLAGLLVALVLLSGCIKVELRENIAADGMSTMNIKLDMSNFPTPDGEQESGPCDNFNEQTGDEMSTLPIALTNMECTSEGKVATITGQLDRKNSLALTIDEGTYRLDVKKVMEEFSSGDTADQQIPTDPQQLQMLKASGFAYDYYITLPGTVTKQEGGELQNDGSVKFDLIDLPAEAYVESSTAAGLFGFDTTTIIIAVVVVIIAIGAAVIMLKR